MTKTIALIEPMSVLGNVFAGEGVYPLLGPLYLASVLKKAGYSVRIFNENLLGRKVGFDELDSDIVCITALTPTVDRAYEIAIQHKAIRPKGLRIMGGAHPSFVPEEAIEFCDYVVVGEGEEVITDLIRHGASEKIVHGTRIKNLDSVPMPAFDALEGASRLPRTPILTSRGCPHNCNFCSVTRMFGNAYRVHSVERVIEELSRVRGKLVFFYDDNFTASPTRTKKLLEAMLRKDLRIRWTAQAGVDVARDEELVAMMKRAGCARLYIGFESIEDSVLQSFNKHQTVHDIIHTVDTLHRFGIAVHAMFILGSDIDTVESARATVEFCRRHRIDSAQFMILTPLPGTPLFEKLRKEGRLLHQRWSYYDGTHAVFEPAQMSARELQNQMIQAYEDFYSLLGALNDGLNALWETAQKIPGLVARQDRVQSFINAVTKLSARAIIRRWLRANDDYLRWLSGGFSRVRGTVAH
jgi:radical SAM superfamily enzyme YgiQ (UPF0313 family)